MATRMICQCDNPNCMRTHWFRMEQKMRDELQKWRDSVGERCVFSSDDVETMRRTLEKISHIIGDETKRGYP